MNIKYEKINIYDKINVYKNALKDTDTVLKMFQRLENSDTKIHSIPPMTKWFDSGQVTGYIGPVPPEFEFEDEDSFIQKKAINDIFNVYRDVFQDYMQEYAGKEGWPDYMTNFNYNDRNVWTETNSISFLKYDTNKWEYNPELGNHKLPMHFHHDTADDLIDAPGRKLAVTITIYLNDDYEGGEIVFVDTKNKKSYSYKPRAGDVTVFPSGSPYLHGVFPRYKNKRYLARMFMFYEYQGSDWWLEKKKQDLDGSWSKEWKEKYEMYYKHPPTYNVMFPGQIPDNNPESRHIYLDEFPKEVK